MDARVCARVWETVCISVGVCVSLCAHGSPHAGGGATVKDGVDLPLCSIRCRWISPCHPLRPPVTTTPLSSGGAAAVGAPHSGPLSSRGPLVPGRESISVWGEWLPEQEAPLPGQKGSPQGAKPGAGIHSLSPVPSGAGVSPKPRPCGCNTLRPHQAEPRAHLHTRPISGVWF